MKKFFLIKEKFILKRIIKDYLNIHLMSFSEYGLLLKYVSLDFHKSDYEGNIMTEYEEKFSEKGNRIYRCEVKYQKLRIIDSLAVFFKGLSFCCIIRNFLKIKERC